MNEACWIPRPQPIGLHPGPAAQLLLPFPYGRSPLSPEDHESLKAILRGDRETPVPSEWQFFLLAAKNDLPGALQDINTLLHRREQANEASLDPHETLRLQVLRYNQFVLNPSLECFDALLSDDHFPPTLRTMTELTAYAYGIQDSLPGDLESLDGELKAWGLAVLSADLIAAEDHIGARQLLLQAIAWTRGTSPMFAAILMSQSAQLAMANHLPRELIQQELEQAIEAANTGRDRHLLSELYMQLGLLLQHHGGSDRHAMQAAVRAYQMALQHGLNGDENPVGFAELQNNLGLAYLSMPQSEASNHLRTGIAIQSFRHALGSIDPETHDELWARISMNLANALQYAPSSHPAENLIQAVEIYETILSVRSRARDPVAYALVILNQANALAHLGIFKPAMEKASEAFKLFQWYNHAEGASTARSLVENMNQHMEGRSWDRTSNHPNEASELEHGSV